MRALFALLSLVAVACAPPAPEPETPPVALVVAAPSPPPRIEVLKPSGYERRHPLSELRSVTATRAQRPEPVSTPASRTAAPGPDDAGSGVPEAALGEIEELDIASLDGVVRIGVFGRRGIVVANMRRLAQPPAYIVEFQGVWQLNSRAERPVALDQGPVAQARLVVQPPGQVHLVVELRAPGVARPRVQTDEFGLILRFEGSP